MNEEEEKWQTLEDYLSEVLNRGGSDLHFSPKSPAGVRLGGKMRPIGEKLLTSARIEELTMCVLDERQRQLLAETWELDFVLDSDQGRFRGNAHYTRNGLEVAYRVLPTDVPMMDELGHRSEAIDLCKIRQGLILITGITGSGKTTTQASMVRTISKIRSGVIVTVEEPVEYVIGHAAALVKQREIGTSTKDYPSALRQALRQDPDVIVVSELRDRESASIALTAAETGHLVIATLHTLDAPGAIDRLLDLYPGNEQRQIRMQLASVLQGILSQHLLPRKGRLGERVLATEILRTNAAVRTAIREHQLHRINDYMQQGKNSKMFSLDQTLLELLQADAIEYSDALAVCHDANFFATFEKGLQETAAGAAK